VSAADRGWGPGWPNCQWDKISTLTRDDGLRLPMRDEILRMVEILMDRTEAGGYDIRPGETWGMACRAIRGSSRPSNHSWGLAVDINAPKNPMASADWHRRNANRLTSTFPFGLQIVTDMSEAMVTLWEDAGWRWGGRYRNRPDPMHFEFMGTPADAKRITKQLTEGGPPMAESDVLKHLQGRKTSDGVVPHRKFVHEQHILTRKLNADQAEKTRVGTVKALGIQAAQLKEDLVLEMTAQTDRVIERMEELAGGGEDGPVTITAADRRAIAETVADVLGDKLAD
jgi:hypothetical protein